MSPSVSPAAFLRGLFDTAVADVQAERCVPPALPPAPPGRTAVLGAGKAAAAMAAAVERHWSGPLEGLVVTRYGHGVPCNSIEVLEAGHPIPDDAGRQAAQRMLALAGTLGPDDLALVLISGGGSSLLALPGEGISLEQKQDLGRALLRSGATIDEINCVRKHLSAIKGGRLAAACAPAHCVTLAISDVPGDDPAVIASGPTVADRTSVSDARAVFRRYAIEVPPAVAAFLDTPGAETPGPGDPAFANAEIHVIANAQGALDAAAARAEAEGVRALVLSDRVEGEARDVARVHAAIATQVARAGQPAAAPCVLLSGGETTVTVRGEGRGGRNAEFGLALAVALQAYPGIHALACDTDGIDGTEDNAGVYMAPDTLARATAAGLDAGAYLANNDGYGFFQRLDDLVITGPTRTNVNDFRAILVTGSRTGC